MLHCFVSLRQPGRLLGPCIQFDHSGSLVGSRPGRVAAGAKGNVGLGLLCGGQDWGMTLLLAAGTSALDSLGANLALIVAHLLLFILQKR